MATGCEAQEDIGDASFIGSDCFYEEYCHPCSEEGQHIEAQRYCSECAEYLCAECVRHHKKSKLSKNHQLLDKDEAGKMIPVAEKSGPIETCAEHDNKVIEYFCSNHDQLCCSVCTTISHRACEDIEYISQVSKGVAESEEYNTFENDLEEGEEQLIDAVKIIQTKLNQVDNSHSDSIQRIVSFRKELNGALDESENKIKKKVEKIKSKESSKLTEMMGICTSFLTEIKTIGDQLAMLKETKQEYSMYIRMKNAMHQLKEFENNLPDVDYDIDSIEYVFHGNRALMDILKRKNAFGNLFEPKAEIHVASSDSENDTSDDDSESSISEDSEENGAKSKDEENGEKYDGEKFGDKSDNEFIAEPLCAFLENDELKESDESSKDSDDDLVDSRPVGSVILPKRQMLVICCMDNQVKLKNTRSGLIHTGINLSSEPKTISKVSDSKVIVTLPREKKIALIRTDPKLTIERYIEVDGECQGVAYADNKLIVSFTHPDRIEIIDLKGTVLQTITTNDQGQQIFSDPLYVNVNPNGKLIYVSNVGNSTVVSLGLDGKVQGIYRDSELKEPRDIAFDGNGRMFVCDKKNESIHQVTEALEKVQISSSFFNEPSFISYENATQRLYVGENDENICIYKLSYSKI